MLINPSRFLTVLLSCVKGFSAQRDFGEQSSIFFISQSRYPYSIIFNMRHLIGFLAAFSVLLWQRVHLETVDFFIMPYDELEQVSNKYTGHAVVTLPEVKVPVSIEDGILAVWDFYNCVHIHKGNHSRYGSYSTYTKCPAINMVYCTTWKWQ